jgi:hypothetical protein
MIGCMRMAPVKVVVFDNRHSRRFDAAVRGHPPHHVIGMPPQRTALSETLQAARLEPAISAHALKSAVR